MFVPDDSFMGRVEKAAAAKIGLDGWYGAIWEKGPNGSILVTGAVCPLKTRGARKGESNWKNRDRATEVKVLISRKEIEEIDRAIKEQKSQSATQDAVSP